MTMRTEWKVENGELVLVLHPPAPVEFVYFTVPLDKHVGDDSDSAPEDDD